MTPRPTMLRLNELALRLGEGALAFERGNRAAIDAHWAKVSAARPGLWNGAFFLFEEVRLEGGTLAATARRTDFATFLFWRDNGRPGDVTHITGTSLPVLADGALLGVRMAAHTANGGEIYFPAGSLEAGDISDGTFDVTGSIARELAEETGLVFDQGAAEDVYTAAFDRGAFHIARRNRLAEDIDACRERISRHQAETGDDEIETAMAIRADDGSVAALKPYARALAEWHFANTAFSCSGKA